MTIQHLARFLGKHNWNKRFLYTVGIMVLFWSVFDGIVSYITPLLMEERGFSNTLIGVILGSSSIAGALFDFFACRIFTSTLFKRMFMVMFALCAIYPFVLIQANGVTMFLVAMAIWGIYWDLKNIGDFDFVARTTAPREHAESFGVLQVLASVGTLVAPLLTGFIVAERLDWKPFAAALIFLAISFFFFGVLLWLTRRRKYTTIVGNGDAKRTTLSEVIVWGKLGRVLFPVLMLTLFLNIIDAAFWTIGPLFAETLHGIHEFAGIFMTAYTLPTLLVGWTVGAFTRRYGQKRTAFISLIIGSLLLMLIAASPNAYFIIGTVFLSSIFISMAWPAINGAYADYISETRAYGKEIEGLEDFYTNLGYIVGPAAVGFAADMLGYAGTFALTGVFGVVFGFILLRVTPRQIRVLSEFKKIRA